MQANPATLDRIDGRPVLRFERLLSQPAERVWRAITDPDELAHWFPARVEAELRVGAPMRFVFEDGPVEQTPGGEVLEVDPPRVFAYRWGDDVLRWEIVPEGGGCRLLFSHMLSEQQGGAAAAARNAAGWDECLAMLEARFGGGLPSRRGSMPRRIEAYVERFGIGRGEVIDRPDGSMLRFVRDLVWNPPERAWATLTGGSAVAVGAPPPGPATIDEVPAGPVTVADPPNALEYGWCHDGEPSGRVRWAITSSPPAATRLTLIHTVPAGLPDLTARAQPAWQRRIGELFAALFGNGNGADRGRGNGRQAG